MKKLKQDQKSILPDNYEQMEPIDRRRFLEYSLKLTVLAASAPILHSQNAQAQTNSINAPTRFVSIHIPGGSCQLGSYLCPTANINDLSTLEPAKWKNPGMTTSFRPSSSANASKENVDYFFPNSGETTSTLYGTEALGSQPIYHARTPVGAYQMPILWSSLIPTGTSGTIQMKELIRQNCAMIYGLESSPAHNIAMNMLLDPEPGSFTVGGYIASASTKSFFPAIGNDRAPRPFKSPSGSGRRVFSGNTSNGGPAQDLLNSLLPSTNENGNATRRAWLSSISDKMKNALESIRISNMGLMPGISDLYNLLYDAKSAVDQNTYSTVITDFNTTLTKYKNLLNRAVAMAPTAIEGITDPATNATITRTKLRTYADPKLAKSNPKTGFTNCTVHEEMAYNFAFAEVALRNNLTHVLQLGFNYLTKLSLEEGVTTLTSGSIDNHVIGVVGNLMSGSLFYYAFNTLLYEFKQNMVGTPNVTEHMVKLNAISDSTPGNTTTTPTPTPVTTVNPWRDTVILLNSEFPRAPRRDGTGSDHGYEAANVTLISGRISGNLKILGKTTYGTSGSYTGAWGKRSNSMYKTDRYINTKDIGASIAGLFVRTTPHPELQTLLDRSKICFSLDANGNITFNPNFLSSYSLENT